MSILRSWILRFGGLFQKEQRDRELEEEIENHLQMHIEDNLRRGMNPEVARRDARLKFGGIESAKERYRDQHGIPWLEHLLQDIRFGLRMLRKNPGFTTVAVLTLALGIGANTAIFSVVDAVLLNPIPFADSDRLVLLNEKVSFLSRSSISYQNFLDWQAESKSFENVAVYRSADVTLTGTGEPERLGGKMVSSNFFSVLGVRPVLGDVFSSQYDQLGAEPVALISEGLWKRRFGADSTVIGKSIVLDGKDYSIIGVIPSKYHLYALNNTFYDDVFLPVGQWNDPLFRKREYTFGLQGIAKLRPGVTVACARAEMDDIAASLAKEYPQEDKNVGVTLLPMKEALTGDIRLPLLILLGAVWFVLLIAAANVANLLLARSSARGQEFAIRAALGASRVRIMRQLFVESILLALAGGTIGVLLAAWGTRNILKIFPEVLPALVNVHMNLGVMSMALAVSLLTGLLFGLIPAFRIPVSNLQDALKEGGRGIRVIHHRTQAAFVIVEVGLALTLLIAAGLLIRSFTRIWAVNPGFDSRNVLSLSIALSAPSTASAEKTRAVIRELTNRISAIPSVEAASADLGTGFFGGDSYFPFWPFGGAPPPPETTNWHFALTFGVGQGFFQAMHIPVIRGRAFTLEDNSSAPAVVVIDEDFANSIFHGENPIGRRMYVNPETKNTAQIIGVVRHIMPFGLDADQKTQIRAQAYDPYEQLPPPLLPLLAKSPSFVIRAGVAPLTLVNAIKRQVEIVDPDAVVYDVRTVDQMISGSLSERRFSMALLGTFAAIALFLAMIGIYAVVSYLVAEQTHEFGIRMALGAQRATIMNGVLLRGGKMALAGATVGIVVSLAFTRIMTSMLFGVRATDALTFSIVVLVLLGVTVMACYVPARRATKVDPMVALRHE